MQKYSNLSWPLRICIVLFVLFTLPLVYMYKMCMGISLYMLAILINILDILWPFHFIRNSPHCLPCDQRDNKYKETAGLEFLTPRTKQHHIKNICQQVLENPKDQTENHKVLLLIQKIAHLEQQAFQQSKKRCKVEQQLFQINIKMIEKNSQIVHEKNRNIKSTREAEQIQKELAQKEQEIEIIEQRMHQLQDELDVMKSKYNQIKIEQLNNQKYDSPQIMV